jgi:hypothetical protein
VTLIGGKMKSEKIKYKDYHQTVDLNELASSCVTLLSLSEKILELHEEATKDGFSNITYDHTWGLSAIDVYGWKEETDAQHKARIESQKEAEAQERKLYEELKAKYETI